MSCEPMEFDVEQMELEILEFKKFVERIFVDEIPVEEDEEQESTAEVETDIRHFSFCVMAYVYRDYFSRHKLPEEVDMDFVIPQSRHFTRAVGEYVLKACFMHGNVLIPLCKELVELLKHDDQTIAYYLKWRSQLIAYTVRFAYAIAEILAALIRRNEVMRNDLTPEKTFTAFRLFCISSVMEIRDKRYRIPDIKAVSEDFKSNCTKIPEEFVKEGKDCNLLFKVRPPPYQISIKDNQYEVIILPYEESPTEESPSCLSVIKFGFEGICQTSPVKKPVCSRCNMDCTVYLKQFVKEFKTLYAQ